MANTVLTAVAAITLTAFVVGLVTMILMERRRKVAPHQSWDFATTDKVAGWMFWVGGIGFYLSYIAKCIWF